MKKAVLGMIILTTMIGALMACSSNNEPDEGASSNQAETVNQAGTKEEESTTEKPTDSGNELTDEYLLSLPETSADDFRYEETDDGGIRIKGYRGEQGEEAIVVIPAQIDGKDVVEIGKTAFERFYGAAVVTGKNVSYIGAEAFVSSTIEKVLLNGPVTKIDEKAFQIANIGEIILPDTLEEIGEGAFNSCSISSIEIPSSTKTIKAGAFSLAKIENVYFQAGEITLEDLAFGMCSDLKEVYINDANISFIDNNIFYNSPNVTILAPAGSTAEEYAKANGIKVENN